MSTTTVDSHLEAEVEVTVGPGRKSVFVCPKCDYRIRYVNAYPLGFQWKVCPGCRRQWLPWPPRGLGPHADDVVGQSFPLVVIARDRSVDDGASEPPISAIN